MYKTIAVETDRRGVATLTLNRTEKHNALSAGMIAELTDAAAQLGADPKIRVVVLTGAGKSFCAGGGFALDATADGGGCRNPGERSAQASSYA